MLWQSWHSMAWAFPAVHCLGMTLIWPPHQRNPLTWQFLLNIVSSTMTINFWLPWLPIAYAIPFTHCSNNLTSPLPWHSLPSTLVPFGISFINLLHNFNCFGNIDNSLPISSAIPANHCLGLYFHILTFPVVNSFGIPTILYPTITSFHWSNNPNIDFILPWKSELYTYLLSILNLPSL